MTTKKVKMEENNKESVCDNCGYGNCSGVNCAHGYCISGCRACVGGAGRSLWWRIFSVIFRMILMLIILAIVFALGATVGGAGVVGYMNKGDFVFGPGMMNGSGMMGDWSYKVERLMGGRGQMTGYENLGDVQMNSPVRIFGNITEVGTGELTILDNSGKEVKVISGSFTIIETSKGELGLNDLKVDEGVTVYGSLLDVNKIKAANIKVSR